MAHGFGGTRDTGLLAYAEAVAEAGIDAFVFDYRGLGASHGTPQLVSCRRQRQDYHAAIAAARRPLGPHCRNPVHGRGARDLNCRAPNGTVLGAQRSSRRF